jgi:MGT family glycosyltransferase
VARLGFVPVLLDAPPPPPLVTGGEALARLVRDPATLRGWIRTLLIDAVPAQIAPVRAALRGFRPAVVATDPMLYQVVLGAHAEGIPWAGISTSLNPVTPEALDAELVATVRALAPARAELFARHGVTAPRFRVCDCLSPGVTTVFATEAYVGDAPVPDRVALVGPSLAPGARGDEPQAPFPWEATGGRPVVYASFGSQIAWQPERFRKLAEACAPLDVALVLSTGELRLDGLPGRVVARSYLPQREILARAAVLVTHGGANSVMEALTAGVPMLIAPVCNDQPLQAWFLERSGAGARCDLDAAPVTEVRERLAALLAPDAPARAAAQRIAASYRARDGARAAAALIAGLAGG